MIRNRWRTLGNTILEEKERILERIRLERKRWKEEDDELMERERIQIMKWEKLNLEKEELRWMEKVLEEDKRILEDEEEDREDSSVTEGKISKQEEI